ncbi:MAG: indole-3-glycerol-phosphate synthase [Sandaracinaceae bacterium]
MSEPRGGRLGPILTRKEHENARRTSHLRLHDPSAGPPATGRREQVHRALERSSGTPVRVIAEVKFRSPSAGVIHPWSPGEAVRVAEGYETAGAAAVSVLADGPGFGGGVLTVRRVSQRVSRPVLFKEFVLSGMQVDLARSVGASMVLLLVRALAPDVLCALVQRCHDQGVEPVVEAANTREVAVAAETGARVIGVNARDLSTFRVDPEAAAVALSRIPEDRIRVYMSGVDRPEDLARVADQGADAALVGTGLMRHADPGARLAVLLNRAPR